MKCKSLRLVARLIILGISLLVIVKFIRIHNNSHRGNETSNKSKLVAPINQESIRLQSSSFSGRDDGKVSSQHSIVHLDLKGAPPKMKYLESILPLMKAAGATGLLIEYEDMFPYGGELTHISAINAYTREEVLSFLKTAKKIGLVTIPLIQTFGHLEFVLKLEKYRHLREIDTHQDSICPSKGESKNLIRKMVKQVMKLHSEVHQVKWFHIGCDEVFHINNCTDCRKRHLTKLNIFINHVEKTAKYIKSLNNSTTSLIWDDMLRDRSLPSSEIFKISGIVHIVIWDYRPQRIILPNWLWFHYEKYFHNGIWVASAYKGASGESALIPDMKMHYENNLVWMHFVSNDSLQIKNHFQGIILTGWSRYSHFNVLCEVLPVSMPSLILNLLVVNNFMIKKNSTNMPQQIFEPWLKLLSCKHPSNIEQLFFYLRSNDSDEVLHYLESCFFDGNVLYALLRKLKLFEDVLYKIAADFFKNSSPYYHYLDNNQIESKNMSEKSIELLMIWEKISKEINHFFDEYTLKEFLEYRISPLKEALNTSNSQQINKSLLNLKHGTHLKRPFIYIN